MLIVPIDRARFFHNQKKTGHVTAGFTRFDGNGLTMSDGLLDVINLRWQV